MSQWGKIVLNSNLNVRISYYLIRYFLIEKIEKVDKGIEIADKNGF